MVDTPPIATVQPRSSRLGVNGWLTVLICLGVLVWLGARGDDWRKGYELSGQRQDYYNLLVDGMLEGHVSMKVTADANGQLPYLLDASLYHGKYYLYFGAVPAVILFLPYAWLTGHDLPPNAASVLLVVGGFVCNLCLYQLARRRYFPDLASGWHVGSFTLIAFGAGTPILAMDSGFYEIAIAGGYLFLSGTLLCYYQTLHAGRHHACWLALASLSGGLAVGCRPTYLLMLPLLLVPVWRQFRQEQLAGGADPAPRGWLSLLGAAVIPAAGIGLLLMAYNHTRFGDPFELGFRHQVNELMRSGLPFARAEFIWPNLRWYYLTPPVISPYFPYVMPVLAGDRPPLYYGYELIHGQWLALVLGLWCLGPVLWLRLKRRAWPDPLPVFARACFLAFLIIFLTTATFGFRANRYVVDFQAALVAMLAVVAGYCAAQSFGASPIPRRLFRTGFGLLALVLSAFNLLGALQWAGHLTAAKPHTARSLTTWGNVPAHWFARLGVLRHESYRLRVKFVRPAGEARREPLLVTGTEGYTDVLFVTQYATGHVDFGIDHTGHGILGSEFMPLDYDREHELEILFGSFYPPTDHPYFRHWTREDITRAKTAARVLLDGTEIITGAQKFYNAPPGAVYIGRNPSEPHPTFSGRILDVERRPLPTREALRPVEETGVWRMTVEFQPFAGQSPQPLLASGTAGNGNLLLVEYVAPNVINLANDQWNYGLVRSPHIPIDFAVPHTIEVFAGPQTAKQALPPEWGIAPSDLAAQASQLKVWIDGTLAWETPIIGNHQSYNLVAVGKNPQGFSSSVSSYEGRLRNRLLSPEDRRALVLRGLSLEPPTQGGNEP